MIPIPRVSIIIPAYNAAKLLPETLDAIVAQTYNDWEAIVVDDASTDQTAAVAIGRDPRISCVRSAIDLGVGGARNLALQQAHGELVAMLDADDLWLPVYLERQVARYDEAVRRGQDVGIVCCDACEFGSTRRRAGTYSDRVGWVAEVTLTTLLRRNTIFVSALVPRAVVDEVGGFATDCQGVEDYDLWLRIVETGRRVISTQETLAMYRIGDATVSTNVALMARSRQTAYRRALAAGRLSRHQRRIARRQLRLQRFVELWQDVIRHVETHRFPPVLLVRAAPLGVCVALEHPSSWSRWLRLATTSKRAQR
jgi:glycosyltransferase involved in cell wall biosynthesis